ncbi:MBOAT family protein [Collinsella tanakaei]|nr:MBOAT family protein [Collinsella tanakaei]
MESYFSVAMLGVILPLTVLFYQLVPPRVRPYVLLAASCVFYASVSGVLIAFVLFSAVSIWLVGLALSSLDRQQAAARSAAADADARRAMKRRYRRYRRGAVTVGVAVNIGLLAVLRYLPHFVPAGGVLDISGIGVPMGISFYSLQAVSYVVDVYRGGVQAERNPLRLALFLSFFPQVMEGPISRYGQVDASLSAGRPITADGLWSGSVRIMWGLVKKMVVADRVNVLVKTVFSDHAAYDGGVIALAAALYTLQLYCDFSGTMDFAVGAGRIFGVTMPENFRQPFASRTAAEFWQRWHISLGAWFRDYVFYPVSLSVPVKRVTGAARRALGNRVGPLAASGIALGCVWLGNGIWHGAGSQYLLFGLYYFVLIWLGGFAGLAGDAVCGRMGVSRSGAAWRTWQRVRTLAVIVVGELIFRASSAGDALAMLSRLVGGFTFASAADGTVLGLGMDAADFALVAVAILVLAAVGRARESGVHPLARLCPTPYAGRAAVVMTLFLVAIVFGAYGENYQPVDPMYAQF